MKIKKGQALALIPKSKNQQLQDIANLLRRDSLQMTTEAGSGHPSSCLSCAEIISVLFFDEMYYEPKNENNPDNDEFVLSKGHAAPILYAALKRAGALEEPLSSYRKLGSHLEGHPVPSPFEPAIKVATGSLGQGLSVGLGMAMAMRMQKKKSRVYVLLGDSEIAEGSIYEACELASYHKVSNICAILDMNRLGQRGQTMLGYDAETYKKRFRSFGWDVLIVDGHSVGSLVGAFKRSRENDKPTLIIAKTVKGKGVSFVENKDGWHGRALTKEEYFAALKEIPPPSMPEINIKLPEKSRTLKESNKKKKTRMKSFKIGKLVATREAYGFGLEYLAERDKKIIVIDAEVSNSTFSEIVKKMEPSHFIEAYIA